MFEEDRYKRPRLIFRPISILYFMILFLGMMIFIPSLFWFIGPLFTYALGLPWEVASAMFFLSLMGSFINIPIMEVVSKRPVIIYRGSFFGTTWIIPELGWKREKTVIALNVGGALVPILISTYLLLYIIPLREIDPTLTYLKVLLALIFVTFAVNRVARPVKGLGIATPGFLPPLITALISYLLYPLLIPSNPCVIAYISGTMGTLLGADLLNLKKIPELGAPIASIGGAGTFDGIYITGVVSIALVLLLH